MLNDCHRACCTFCLLKPFKSSSFLAECCGNSGFFGLTPRWVALRFLLAKLPNVGFKLGMRLHCHYRVSIVREALAMFSK
jgi:hypothetical protein